MKYAFIFTSRFWIIHLLCAHVLQIPAHHIQIPMICNWPGSWNYSFLLFSLYMPFFFMHLFFAPWASFWQNFVLMKDHYYYHLYFQNLWTHFKHIMNLKHDCLSLWKLCVCAIFKVKKVAPSILQRERSKWTSFKGLWTHSYSNLLGLIACFHVTRL